MNKFWSVISFAVIVIVIMALMVFLTPNKQPPNLGPNATRSPPSGSSKPAQLQSYSTTAPPQNTLNNYERVRDL